MSAIRTRVIAAFDHFTSVRSLSDEAAARRIRDDEIDILIDLNGLTSGGRLQILRWKPAPVQGGDEFGADGAGDTGNGYNGVAHSDLLRAIKKAPDLFRRGFGLDDAIVRLRAHASPSPRRRVGFRSAFGVGGHGAGLCGRFRLASTGFGPKIDLNKVEPDTVVTQ